MALYSTSPPPLGEKASGSIHRLSSGPGSVAPLRASPPGAKYVVRHTPVPWAPGHSGGLPGSLKAQPPVHNAGALEQSVPANLLAEHFGSLVGEELIPNGKRAAVLAALGFFNEVSANDFRLHPPVVVSSDIPEPPPETRMISVMI